MSELNFSIRNLISNLRAHGSASSALESGIAVVLLLAMAATIWSLRDNGDTVTGPFWAAVLQSRSPILISLGHPVVYHLSRRIHDQYRAGLTTSPDPGPYGLSSLQAGWRHRNIQFVIRTEVVGSSPGPPDLVTATVGDRLGRST
jgi:hypothetical protein